VAVLLDTAPPGLAQRIIATIKDLPQIESVGPVRVRQSGASIFVDVTVGVDRSVSLEAAHEIATRVESRVEALAPRGDVVVHVDPVQQSGESLIQAVGAVAGRLGLQTHNIQAHEVQGHYYVNLHLEVPAEFSLDEAHAQASLLEDALHREMPRVKEINTHIEPLPSVPVSRPIHNANSLERIRSQVLAAVNATEKLGECHNVRIWSENDGYHVTIHCLANPTISILEAHHRAEQLEKRILSQLPAIHAVHVHVEPEGQAGNP
jgi:divalent metal cation (Fe/Co/Zn/Cd) transporter